MNGRKGKIEIVKWYGEWMWRCNNCVVGATRRTWKVAMNEAQGHIAAHRFAEELVYAYEPGGSVWERLRKGFVS